MVPGIRRICRVLWRRGSACLGAAADARDPGIVVVAGHCGPAVQRQDGPLEPVAMVTGNSGIGREPVLGYGNATSCQATRGNSSFMAYVASAPAGGSGGRRLSGGGGADDEGIPRRALSCHIVAVDAIGSAGMHAA